MLLDTHLHLVNRDLISYPWLGDAPALDQNWTYEAYAEVAKRVGITRCLHMEVDVAEEDIARETEMVRTLKAREDNMVCGAIASGRPEHDGFAAYLESLDTDTVKGIRRVLHVVPDEVSQSPLFRENIKSLESRNLPFDICVLEKQLPLACALADAAPNVSFVLDHCGVPEIAGGDYQTWADKISDLAQRQNVNAKISGIIAYTGGGFTLETLRPYVEHVISVFGWDRVVWGSDSPVCTLAANLETWVAATYALTQGCSANERAKLFHENATRIWNIT
ncbi:MAG: amidohydrolase [Rhodobacteraceae bacterium]|nr:amidohydrolase [Paracoccaceae bacterium]